MDPEKTPAKAGEVLLFQEPSCWPTRRRPLRYRLGIDLINPVGVASRTDGVSSKLDRIAMGSHAMIRFSQSPALDGQWLVPVRLTRLVPAATCSGIHSLALDRSL